MRFYRRSTRTLIREIAHHLTVVLMVLSLVSVSPLQGYLSRATAPDIPNPLTVQSYDATQDPRAVLLAHEEAGEWATDSEGFERDDDTLQPPPVVIGDARYVPYRLHTFSDAVAVELAAITGTQFIALDVESLTTSLYSGGDGEPLILVGSQSLVFERYEAPTSGSEDAGSWLSQDVDYVNIDMRPDTDRVRVTRTFVLADGSEGAIDAEFGYDGVSPINKWTYRIDAPAAGTYRLVAHSSFAGEVTSVGVGGKMLFEVTTPPSAPILDIPTPTASPAVNPETTDETTPSPGGEAEPTNTDEQVPETPSPTPDEEASGGLPDETPVSGDTEQTAEPTPEPTAEQPQALMQEPAEGDAPGDGTEQSGSLHRRVLAHLFPVARADDTDTAENEPLVAEPTSESTPEPVPTQTESVEPVETLSPSAEPPLSPTPETSLEPSEGPVPSGTPIPSEYPLPTVLPEPPGPIGKLYEWLSGLFGDSGGRVVPVVFDITDHRGPATVVTDEHSFTVIFEAADNTPEDAAFCVDPSFGVQSADTGVTITSGDGSGNADFRIRFNPSLGGAIDELYTGADFVTNKVAPPASSFGSLLLTAIDGIAQTAVSSSLTVTESGPVRIIVENTVGLPSGDQLIERYAVYPSGRIVHTTQATTADDASIIAAFNASSAGLDAAYADHGESGALYLSDDGPDMLMYWQNPSALASASVVEREEGTSFITDYVVPVPAGQTTWYQLLEITQDGINPLVPESYRSYANDYRNPDAPVMTRGSFLGYAPARATYQFEAVNNVVVFRLNGNTTPRINPTFEIAGWTDPDLTSFKAQLNGASMEEGVDYVVGFQNDDPYSGVLLFQYLHTVDANDRFGVEGGPPLFDLDPSDAAAIKRVQRGTAELADTVTNTTIALPYTVVTSRSFVLTGDRWGGGIAQLSDPEMSRWAGWLAGPTSLNLRRTGPDSAGGISSLSWQVIEFEDNTGAFVQRGSTSWAAGTITENIALPAPVDTNKAFALITVRGGGSAQDVDEQWTVRASLSATTLNLSRNEDGTEHALVITWQVVQLSGITVQRGLTTFSGATGTNITIAPVNTAKSFIVSSARASAAVNGVDSSYQFNQQLTGPTTLRFSKSTATSGIDIAWFVVTFSGTSGIRTQRGTVTPTTWTAATGFQEADVTVPTAVVATRSMVLTTSAGAAGGDEADLDATTFGLRGLNASGSSFHMARYSNTDGSARSASTSWEVVQFTRPSILQNRSRWRNDDGSETGATWAAAENASISLELGTTYRLRFGLYDADTGSVTNQYRLEFARKAAGGDCATGLASGWGWLQVPVSPSVASDAFNIVDSEYLTDAAPTTNVAGGLTDDDSVFIAGEVKDSGSQTTSIGMASTSFTEIEYALAANGNAAVSGKYCFRLTDAGEDRASHSFIFYPQYAEAEVTAAPATFTQRDYRWFVDRNGLPVTDPWTRGTPGDFGTGADGSVTLSSTGNYNTTILGSLRSGNPDGVTTSLTASPSGTTLTVSSTTGFVAGDEIMVLDTQAASSSTAAVGNYEFLTITDVPNSTTLVVETAPKLSYVGASSSTDTITQTYTTAASTSYTIPSGYTSATVKVWGAGGGGGEGGGGGSSGGAGGGGGYATATFTVTPGESLTINVGTGGAANTGAQKGGNGGGYSAVIRGATYLVTAGAGGGGGSADSGTGEAGGFGGAGGGTTGENGQDGGPGFNDQDGGDGGTQVAGGVGGSQSGGENGSDGVALAGGNGGVAGTGGAGGIGGGGLGDTDGNGGGGGGGSGFFGGGGAESGAFGTSEGGGGGGGGSSGFDGSVSATSTTAGSGATPGNTGDSDYAGGAGAGGTGSATADGATAGAAGRVVLRVTNNQNYDALHKVIVQRIPQWTNVTINSGGTLTVSAWNGTTGGLLVFRATGTVTVNTGGSISVAGLGYQGGAAITDASAVQYAYQGASYPRAGAIATIANGGGGGGGFNDYDAGGESGSSGGGGGYATAGTAGADSPEADPGALGGSTYGNKNLTKLFFGSGGGGGGADNAGTDDGGNGGAGGGIIYIAADTVTLPGSGTVSANGTAGTASVVTWAGSGGGGAGGSIFITGETLSLGTGLMTASGGTGGVGPSPSTGGAGGNGRISVASDTVSGTTNPTAFAQSGMTYGASDLDEDIPGESQYIPADVGSSMRLRMNLSVNTGSMTAGSQAFRLQYAELPYATFACSDAVAWSSVVASTSATPPWRYGSNSALSDGMDIVWPVLTDSSVSGTYEEANPTAVNPYAVASGQRVEYDFPLYNEGATYGSKYCFRLIRNSGAELDAYDDYPFIVTQPSPQSVDVELRHGDFFSTQGEEQPFYWAEIQ